MFKHLFALKGRDKRQFMQFRVTQIPVSEVNWSANPIGDFHLYSFKKTMVCFCLIVVVAIIVIIIIIIIIIIIMQL
jgi:hypothetical protein